MKNEKILSIIFIFIVVPLLTLILLSIFTLQSWTTPSDEAIKFNNEWNYKRTTNFSSINSSNFRGASESNVIYLSNTLPEIKIQDPTLYFETEQQRVKVFINNVYTYEYRPPVKWFSHTPGDAIHFIKLNESMSGSIIEIEVSSSNKKHCRLEDSICIANKSSLYINLFRNDFIPMILSFTVLLLGIILIFAFFTLYLSGIKELKLIYLSLFAIFSGLWMISERMLLLIFLNDPVFIFNLSFFTLYLLPLPLLLFINSTYKLREKIILLLLSWAFLGLVTISAILQIFDILQLAELLPIYHVLSILSVISVCWIGIREIRSGHNRMRIFVYGCFIFCIFVIAEIMAYYILSFLKTESHYFFQFSILLFISFIISSFWDNFFYYREMQIKNNLLLSLAYTDGLTHLKNRTSFDEMIRALNTTLESERSIHLIILDINNLKIINDSLGHTEGDRYITDGAKILRNTLESLGEIYRIGGDEFAIIIRNIEEGIINQAISDMFEQIDKYNKHPNSFKMSIAYGMSSYRKDIDKDLHSVFVRADKAMYNCKVNQKHIQVID